MPLTTQKEKWILVAYEQFALHGWNGLKIDVLSHLVGVSKSSFYHHFADMDLFMDLLLEHHLGKAKIMAQQESTARSIDPELLAVLLEHRLDLLFSRQLRVHRDKASFAHTIAKTDSLVGEAIFLLWVRELNPKLTKNQLQGIFELALENFFLQMSPENFSLEWLSGYFANLKKLAAQF
jgi:AcrR family transcriptional regulator